MDSLSYNTNSGVTSQLKSMRAITKLQKELELTSHSKSKVQRTPPPSRTLYRMVLHNLRCVKMSCGKKSPSRLEVQDIYLFDVTI